MNLKNFGIIFVLIMSLSMIAHAESGGVTVEQLTNWQYTTGSAADTATWDGTKIYWYSAGYNYISYFRMYDAFGKYSLSKTSY